MRAAKTSSRHIVALEGDTAIFKEILDPLQFTDSLEADADVNMQALGDSDEDEPLPDKGKISLCK